MLAHIFKIQTDEYETNFFEKAEKDWAKYRGWAHQ